MRTTRLALAALIFGLPGCEPGVEGAYEPKDPTTLDAPYVPGKYTLKARMRDHDKHGAAMRDAITHGDLEAARSEAKMLADLRAGSDIEAPWRKRLEAMNAAAARVARAKDITEASAALGAAARTCGDCHETLGGPTAIVGEAPEPAPGVLPRMQRHQWAVTRMWDGLVAPSEASWSSGARVLSDAPLEPNEITPGKSSSPVIGALARSVHDLARTATVVKSPVDRGPIYGELVATCAACHEKVHR